MVYQLFINKNEIIQLAFCKRMMAIINKKIPTLYKRTSFNLIAHNF